MNGRVVIVDDEPITRFDIRDIRKERATKSLAKQQMVLKSLKFVRKRARMLF